MESGPRALGGRSILFDPGKPENKDIINMRVKFREPFRPFCPSIMEEYAHEYLVTNYKDRYMITACKVKDEKRTVIPAVTHVDGTCRPQFISRQTNRFLSGKDISEGRFSRSENHLQNLGKTCISVCFEQEKSK